MAHSTTDGQPAWTPIGHDPTVTARKGTALCVAAGLALAFIGMGSRDLSLGVFHAQGGAPGSGLLGIAVGALLLVGAWRLRPAARLVLGSTGIALICAVTMLDVAMAGLGAEARGAEWSTVVEMRLDRFLQSSGLVSIAGEVRPGR